MKISYDVFDMDELTFYTRPWLFLQNPESTSCFALAFGLKDISDNVDILLDAPDTHYVSCCISTIQDWVAKYRPEYGNILKNVAEHFRKVSTTNMIAAYHIAHMWWKFLSEEFGPKTNSYEHVGHRIGIDDNFAKYGNYVCKCTSSHDIYIVGFTKQHGQLIANIYKTKETVIGNSVIPDHHKSRLIKSIVIEPNTYSLEAKKLAEIVNNLV